MTKRSNIKTVKIKIRPGEFTPIYATFNTGRTILYTMDIFEDLKSDPDIIEITTPGGVTLYKKEA